jgi:exosortase N
MINTLHISLKGSRTPQPVHWMTAGYLLIAAIGLAHYLSLTSASFLMGLVALPFTLHVYTGQGKSYRYAWVTFVAASLCFFMPVKTLLFFTICFAIIFVRESLYGKSGVLVPAIVILMSPVFQYLATTFSFPIRMQLTAIAAQVFRLTGYTAEAQGNVIIFQGNEFSVDPACMGLNMITTSLLTGIILVAYYQTRFDRRLGNWKTLLYLGIVLLFNIVANLFRILILVLFNIPPGSLSHDVAGICCLLVYVFLPAVLFAFYLVKRSGTCKSDQASIVAGKFSYKHILFHGLMIGSISLLAWKVSYTDTFSRFKIPSGQQLAGYSASSPAPGIVKLENKEALVYIKYIRGFYDTDHNPMICWTGSGYQFAKVQHDKIAGNELLTATLTNNNDKLYSAWWYDNGHVHTADHLKWRLDLLQGAADYILVNVTCTTREKLTREVERLFHGQTLFPFYEKDK